MKMSLIHKFSNFYRSQVPGIDYHSQPG